MRRSPVQPLHVAVDYRRRLVARAVTAAVVLAAVGVGIYLLSMLGIFTR